jgi:PTH1 family peptidyl-tRNA hydrolase
MQKHLIAGLGNIGAEYAGTRHNIGFDVADAFVQRHEGVFRTDRLAAVTELKWKGKMFVCIKPSTYMNLSGKAVKYYLDKENISIEHLLVILDDLALPLDKIRLRPAGSSGGHNGLKSIEETLGTDKYPKLRFGIGNDFPKGRQVDYVLGKWAADELPLVNHKTAACVELIENFAQAGIASAMNAYNKLTFKL